MWFALNPKLVRSENVETPAEFAFFVVVFAKLFVAQFVFGGYRVVTSTLYILTDSHRSI